MTGYIQKYIEVVRSSSVENEKSIKILYGNRLFKNVAGILREELELYIRTLYLSNQSGINRESLLTNFINNKQWVNAKGKRLTDREMLEFASKIKGYGWEQISYRFACCFIHLSILHNWDNEDVTTIINANEKKIVINYINQYHGAKLNSKSSFSDIMEYSLAIFKKIKENMECYLDDLNRIQ